MFQVTPVSCAPTRVCTPVEAARGLEANANAQPSRHPLAINPSFMHSELLRLVSSRLASVLHRLASPCLALLYAPCVAFPESSLAAVAVSIHWPSRGAPQTGSTRRLSLPETPSSHSLVSSRLLFSCSAAVRPEQQHQRSESSSFCPSFSAQGQDSSKWRRHSLARLPRSNPYFLDGMVLLQCYARLVLCCCYANTSWIHHTAIHVDLYIHPRPRWPQAPDPIARYGPDNDEGWICFRFLWPRFRQSHAPGIPSLMLAAIRTLVGGATSGTRNTPHA